MATNSFIPVTFNDGEPLDPVKLNKLVDNINNIYQNNAVSLSNSSTGTVPQTPVIFTYRHKFENVKAGTPQNTPISFGDKFTSAELSASKVYISTGIRASVTDKDVITASVGGVSAGNPTLYVNFSGDNTRTIYVDVIAICMRDIAG
jgi:hypothetical protein